MKLFKLPWLTDDGVVELWVNPFHVTALFVYPAGEQRWRVAALAGPYYPLTEHATREEAEAALRVLQQAWEDAVCAWHWRCALDVGKAVELYRQKEGS